MKLLAQATTEVFGTIQPPEAVEQSYGVLGGGGAGLTGLISNVIILISIVGGLWALFNILKGGFELIVSGGDPKKLSDLGMRISMTFVGLMVMVGAPMIAALIGYLVFGSTTSLLNPQITGPVVGP